MKVTVPAGTGRTPHATVRGLWLRNKWRLAWLKPTWIAWRDLRRKLPGPSGPAGRPTGALSIDEWIAANPTMAESHEVFPAEHVRRIAPGGLPGRTRAELSRQIEFDTRPDRVYVVEGARLVGGRYPALITSDGMLLEDLSPDVWGAPGHSIHSRLRLPPCRQLPGLTAVVTTPGADNNYGHWMMDLLARLLLLEIAGFDPARVDRYFINVGRGDYCRETLKLLGIPEANVAVPDRRTHVRCERMVTVTWQDWRFALRQWIAERLPRRLVPAPSVPDTARRRRIYLSREGALFRRVRNEAACMGVLAAHGFDSYRPERESVRGQAKVFREAEAIVSVHGSGLANLMFCVPGTKVLEIFPDDFRDQAPWSIASARKLDYRVLDGRTVGGPGARRCHAMRGRADIEVDPKTLRAALRDLLG